MWHKESIFMYKMAYKGYDQNSNRGLKITFLTIITVCRNLFMFRYFVILSKNWLGICVMGINKKKKEQTNRYLRLCI